MASRSDSMQSLLSKPGEGPGKMTVDYKTMEEMEERGDSVTDTGK